MFSFTTHFNCLCLAIYYAFYYTGIINELKKFGGKIKVIGHHFCWCFFTNRHEYLQKCQLKYQVGLWMSLKNGTQDPTV